MSHLRTYIILVSVICCIPLTHFPTTAQTPQKRPVISSRSNTMQKDLVCHLTLNGHAKNAVRSSPPAFVRGAVPIQKSSLFAIPSGYEFRRDSDVIRVRDDAILDCDDAFSIALWVRPTAYKDNSGRYGFLCSKWYTSPIHGDFIFSFCGPHPGRVQLVVSNTAPRFASAQLQSKSKIAKHQWTHLVAVFDRGHMQIFINGHLDTEQRSMSIKHTNRHEYIHDDLYFGSHRVPNKYAYRGRMADLRFYKRALSRAEVSEVFWHALPAVPRAKKQRMVTAQHWHNLGTTRASTVLDAAQTLIAARDQSVMWIAAKLAEKRVDAKQIRSAIKQIDHEQFRVRERAQTQLYKWGDITLPYIRTALKKPNSLEARLRLDALRKRLEADFGVQNRVRRLRNARVVLRRIGTTEARKLQNTLTTLLGKED